jgi:hypothetical protein
MNRDQYGVIVKKISPPPSRKQKSFVKSEDGFGLSVAKP